MGAELEAFDGGFHVGGAREDDHGGVGVGLADGLKERDAVHHGHLEIGDGERGERGAERLEPLAPVARELAGIARGEEDLVKDFSDLPVVVDDQDVPGLLHIFSLSGCSMAATWFFPARLAE